jgi:predicted dehydrogenase
MKRKIRYGMIGGGIGGFIGAIHRMAAAMDQQIELVSGAFSSAPERSHETGAQLFLPPERCYPTFEEMIRREATLPFDTRPDFIAIVTPNHLHLPAAQLALQHGFHVLSDKPATLNLKEAIALRDAVRKSGLLYGLTHNYTGYPMIKEARHLIRSGKLGRIRKVVVEYPQGWLPIRLAAAQKHIWRTDPQLSGVGGCVADIGTHAENLAEYVTGLKIVELAADASTFMGRLDDDINILLRLENDAKGVLHASQICVGEENNLNIRVWGELGGLEWHQTEPNTLLVKWPDRPAERYRAGTRYLGPAARSCAHTPAGHPEGFIEAFANVYLNFANHIRALHENRKLLDDDSALDYPKIDDAVRGMEFVEAVLESSASNASWTGLAVDRVN